MQNKQNLRKTDSFLLVAFAQARTIEMNNPPSTFASTSEMKAHFSRESHTMTAEGRREMWKASRVNFQAYNGKSANTSAGADLDRETPTLERFLIDFSLSERLLADCCRVDRAPTLKARKQSISSSCSQVLIGGKLILTLNWPHKVNLLNIPLR